MIYAHEGPAAYPPKALSRPFAGPSYRMPGTESRKGWYGAESTAIWNHEAKCRMIQRGTGRGGSIPPLGVRTNFGYGRIGPSGAAITFAPSNCPGARIPRLIIAKDLPGNITVRRTSDSKNPGKTANPSPGRSGLPNQERLFIGVLGVGPVEVGG